MSVLKPPSALEKVTGSPAALVGMTAVGVQSGIVLGALLPVLSNSLASQRQLRRIERAFADVSAILESHEAALRDISDAQYKLINETVLAFLHSTSDEKLIYLRNAVRNGLAMTDVQPDEAVVLGRLVRDISAGEAKFLIEKFRFRRIQLDTTASPVSEDVLDVSSGGQEELIVSGLMALGLLIPAGSLIDDMGLLRFSAATARVIALLRQPDA